MTLDAMMTALYDDLLPWVEGKKGRLSVAKDPWNVLEILVNGPQGFQVILHWGGDSDVGELPGEPMAENIIEVIVGYSLGLQAKPDVALIKNQATRSSLLKHVNDVRARVLAYVFPAEETGESLQYAGCEPLVTPDGIPLAAYKFRAKLTARVEQEASRTAA